MNPKTKSYHVVYWLSIGALFVLSMNLGPSSWLALIAAHFSVCLWNEFVWAKRNP